ncbi:unnamed protein product [Paramecium primaurelia]|uniref:VASt domain-containing protein n=1 Tax=Paramecium primaurelia TaxID=5886 RepID=A0A8S1KXY1_PARPR|nr:unnamed protein product [Paramecium primaurelia]
MLNPSEQTATSTLNDKLEDLKKIMKQYSKYTSDSQNEFEQHFKKFGPLNKQYYQQISLSVNDPISLGQNLIEFIQLFEMTSKSTLSQFSEFQQFFSQSIEQYNEKMNIFTKIITDGNFQQSQQLAQHRQNFKKAKDKYDKLCKEIETTLSSSKKNSGDALTGYDLNLSQKNDQKLKDLVKQVEPAEQQYKETFDSLTIKTKEFNQAIDDSRQQLIQAHQLTYQRFVEITMKLDQHKLSANCWIKGQMDEKQEKILTMPKYEQEIEDRIITSKYEQDNQFRYINIMNKIIEKKQLTDSEYIMFPDILHKHIDAQLSFINDRLKNQKALPNYLIEISNQMDSVSKNLQKSIKTSLQFIQDKSDKDKSNFIKPILQVQELLVKQNEQYSKKFNQQSQFIQLKAQCLDQLIKEQKIQEKSFLNMYQKMLKDFQGLKQQMLENEQKPAIKDNLLQQLKKSIQDNCTAIKYSIDSIRANEFQRSNQIIQTLEQILNHYSSFIDEIITYTKQQEETLSQIQQKIVQVDYGTIINIKLDQIDLKFQRMFEMTDEIKSKIETATLLQQQEESESDDINLEEGSVKVSQKLIEKFRILDGDKCIASYACAFENKILLQGRMYIFSSKVCFHSYFNGKTLFGTTALGIPSIDIQSIRRIKAYMVDAALEFKTQKGILVFASLANRDRTLGSLKQVKGLEQGIIEEKIENDPERNIQQIYADTQLLAKPQEKQQGIRSPSPKPQANLIETINIQNLEQSNDKLQQIDKSPRNQNIQQQSIVQQQQIPQITINEPTPQIQEKKSTFESTSQQQQNQTTNQQIKTDKQQQQSTIINTESQNKSNPALPKVSQIDVENTSLYNEIMIQNKQNRFMNQPNILKFKTQLKVTVKEFIDFFLLDNPYENCLSFPHYYQVVICQDKDIEFKKYQPQPQIGQISKRPINFIHPVKEKQMFAPDVVHCFAEDILYYFNQDEILIEKEVKFAKIPYADSFCCRVFWHIHQIDGGCQVNYGFYIHFLKSTVFKGKIESGSKKENTDVWEKCLKQVYEEGQNKIISKRIQSDIRQQPKSELEIPQQVESQVEKEIVQREKQQTQVINLEELQQESQMLLENKQQNQQLIIKEVIIDNKQSQSGQQDLNLKLDKLIQLSYAIIGLLIINILFAIGK